MKHLRLYTEPQLAAVEQVVPIPVDSECSLCPLSESCKHPCLSPEGSNEQGGLLVVSDHPLVADDVRGRPYSSTLGNKLRRIIREHWDGPVYLDYAIKCAPKKGKRITDIPIASCRPYLAQTIEECKPSKIIIMGAAAMKVLLGRGAGPFSTRKSFGWLEKTKTPVFMLMSHYIALNNRFLAEWFTEDLKWALSQDVSNLRDQSSREGTASLISTREESESAVEILRSGEWVCYDTETVGKMFNKDFQVISIAICSKHDEDAYVWSEEALKDKDIMQPVFDMMEDPSVLKVAQNAKYDSNAMFSSFGVVVRGLHLDTRLIRKILEPESVAKLDVLQEQVGMGGGKEIASQAIAVIARKLKKAETDIDLAEIGPIAWTKPLHNKGCALGVYAYGLIDKDVRDRYCGRDTVSTARVAELYEQRLSGTSIKTVWEDIMLPAAKAIEYVERWGVAVDREFVDKFEGVVTREKDATLSKLFMRGEFNLNSTRELGDRLYKDYKLPIVSKTATGNPSTDRATLDMLAARDLDPEQQEFVDTMLEYRKLAKMHSTYATKLGGFIRSDGRVHPSFNLVGARSGRISCLAGWTPIKTKRGFVPIKNVRVGDLVWTHKERWRPVLAQWLVGTEDTYDVTLCNGEVLTCTATHRVLNSTGSWTFIEDYINERFKEVDKRPGKPTEGSCLVQEAQPATYNKTGIRQPGGDDSERVPCVAESHAGSRKEGSSNSPVLPFQDGQEKSHEGKNGEEAPQLEGAVRRRLRLPDVYAQGEESVCSQVSVRAEHGPGTCTTASENDCPPHRQRSEEQPHRQFSTCDKRGARSYTLFTGEGFPVCSIEEINYRGSIQVYDLTVEEDESYEACGVFSHNCSDPNVQQIPRADTELSSMARDCFIAPPGRMLVQVDYSQLELRIAAMLSNDTNMIDVFKSGEDYHMRTAQLISKQAWGIEPDQVTKLHRTMAKSVNFGLLYGMSVGTLAKSIGCEKSEATKIQSAVFGSFPSLKRWCDDHVQMARRTGNGYTYWNGKKARVRPLFRIADQEDHARKTAENGSFNTPVQGTASDLCIASLARCVNWILEHKFPAKMVLTVHDSLLFEVAEDYVDEMVETAQHLMSDWESNGVPLVVDAEIGKTWGRLKNYS